ncbi:MAG: DUF4153 domain-containing protein [Saprospiraceae bacterium]|nr:DUF4153 domain-containing protein [Saprospiraceae bacterium]
MAFFSIENIQGRFFEIIKRFPLVIIFALVTTITLIITIDHINGNLFRCPVSGFIGFLAVLNLTIAKESYKLSPKVFYILFGILLCLLGLYFSVMPLDFTQNAWCFWFFTLGLSLILHFLMAIIPFGRRYEFRSFTTYNVRLFIAWMQAALYGLILYLALCLAILALDNLFDIHFNSIIYFKLFILITGLFHTSFFLSEVPDDFYDVSLPTSKSIFRVLTAFVIIPITLFYGLILYAYIVKLLVSGQGIVDWVSIMILWYFILGILGYLFSGYYENAADHPIMTLFRKYFFIFSIPFVGLFFISLYKNINLFGIKEELYLLTACAVFILMMTLYIISTRGGDRRWIPVILILLSLITFMGGPISICELPLHNQQNKLITEFEKTGIIKNGAIVIDTSASVWDSTGNIQQILNFLESRNGLSFLKEYDEHGMLTTSIDSLNVYQLANKLGLYNQSKHGSKDRLESYFDTKSVLNVSGFDLLIPIKNKYEEFKSKDYLNILGHEVILVINDKEIGKSDISQALLKMSPEKKNSNILDLVIENQKVRLIVNSVSAKIDGEKVIIEDMQGFVLVKEITK